MLDEVKCGSHIGIGRGRQWYFQWHCCWPFERHLLPTYSNWKMREFPEKDKEICIWPNFKCEFDGKETGISISQINPVASFEIRFIPSRQHFSIARSFASLILWISSTSARLVLDKTEEMARRQADQPSCQSSHISSRLNWRKKGPQALCLSET